MLKENKKMKSSQIKEEKARITKLVAMAYKQDPRIIKEEQRLQEIREKLKLERTLQKQKRKRIRRRKIKIIKKNNTKKI